MLEEGGEALSEILVVLRDPVASFGSDGIPILVRHSESFGDGCFERGWIDVEIDSEVAGFVFGSRDEKAAARLNEFVHGGGIGGYDGGSTTHGFDDVVAPAF